MPYHKKQNEARAKPNMNDVIIVIVVRAPDAVVRPFIVAAKEVASGVGVSCCHAIMKVMERRKAGRK